MSIKILLLLFVSVATIYAQKIEYTLSSAGDTTKNYYVTVHPQSKPKALLILLPGFGGSPRETLTETDIYKYASESGILTVIPALGDWSFFYIDDASHEKLVKQINEVTKKYSMSDVPFFIGGFSFGGTMAMQYAIRANEPNSALRIPSAVFAIDAPLDLERLYNCMVSTNHPGKKPVTIQEDAYVSERMRNELKIDPEKDPKSFWKISPFSQNDPEHTSLKNILSLPFRFYAEPDISWHIDNRSTDYYCMNVIDNAAMINWLRSKGNSKAELVTTTGKGYRKDGRRHPHSWSIADGEDLVKWLSKNLK